MEAKYLRSSTQEECFEAGKKAAAKRWRQTLIDSVALAKVIGKQAGIEEVVDYVSAHIDQNSYDEYWGYFVIDPEDWAAKLKDWGINETE